MVSSYSILYEPQMVNPEYRLPPDVDSSVLQQWCERLVRIAQGQLGIQMQKFVDPEDPAQSAVRTFLRHNMEGKYRDIDSNELFLLLAGIVRHKVCAAVRRHSAQQRDRHREVTFDEDLVLDSSDDEKAAALRDEIQWLLRGEPDSFGQILKLRLQGLTQEETATSLNRSRQFVRKALGHIRKKLESRL